ncbi:MAG: hypothetical protein PHY14_04670 [Candidatus Gracilibacteria bacterium]|nr:hypothetical protein [Candidatus Gracilibacteria bacterium]
MKYLFFLLFILPIRIFAEVSTTGVNPSSDIWAGESGNGWTLEMVLSYIEKVLVRGAVPLIITGVTLYIGYQLMTAEGDEEKMKKAFKSLTYGAIGLIAIACAYTFVVIISGLSL